MKTSRIIHNTGKIYNEKPSGEDKNLWKKQFSGHVNFVPYFLEFFREDALQMEENYGPPLTKSMQNNLMECWEHLKGEKTKSNEQR